MSLQEFEMGQRWISDTEAELGLGLVLDVADRLVTLSFPAAGERRTYSINNAPITRVRYQKGDSIRSADGLKLQVTRVEDLDGILIYHGLDNQGRERLLEEIELDSFVQFSTPADRLFSGQVDSQKRFDLRLETLEQVRKQQSSPTYGLLGARVQMLAHQLYIAHEVGNRYAPRVLLADEVGLGKTIEAGLIVHQQLVNGRASRVLILVPDSLVHQWLVEMLRRFNLRFTLLTEERLRAEPDELDVDDAPTQDNPFESAQLFICPLSLMTDHPAHLAQALACDWDLLLVDEAHHLTCEAGNESDAYRVVAALAQQALGLLLLTATPEQLGVESHFARLRLLDPDRYHDLAAFVQQESDYQKVGDLLQSVQAGEAPDPEQLVPWVSPELLQAWSTAESPAEKSAVAQKIIDRVLDQHGTGRVLFRNTRHAVEGFPSRILHAVELTGVVADTDQSDWTRQCAKVNWLAGWLKQHPSEKVLVICHSANTALDLEAHLRFEEGFAVSAFHEGLSLVARDRAAAYFADQEAGAQALICSEIGSEGRNFQFASHLIMFDLPDNPDLLEQRIGRLDRIGQRRDVNIWVPFVSASKTARLLEWYHQGLNAFEQVCHIGAGVYAELGDALREALQSDSTGGWQTLLEQTRVRAGELREKMEQGRNRLLEMNSCRTEKADQVIESLIEQENRIELEDYMSRVFDAYGVDQEAHSSVSQVLVPSDHLQCAHFPELPADGVTVTYQREMALSREDVEFLTWEHPMVTGVMDMIRSSGFGNTAVATVKLGPIKPGTLLLEAVFLVSVAAPSALQLFRYLPVTPLRVLVDSQGRDLSAVLPQDKLQPLLQKIPRNTAQQIAKQARDPIALLIKRAEQVVEDARAALMAQAVSAVEEKLSAEIERLQALSTVNPAIRPVEIERLSEDKSLLKEYLASASLKLDALRVILAT